MKPISNKDSSLSRDIPSLGPVLYGVTREYYPYRGGSPPAFKPSCNRCGVASPSAELCIDRNDITLIPL